MTAGGSLMGDNQATLGLMALAMGGVPTLPSSSPAMSLAPWMQGAQTAATPPQQQSNNPYAQQAPALQNQAAQMWLAGMRRNWAASVPAGYLPGAVQFTGVPGQFGYARAAPFSGSPISPYTAGKQWPAPVLPPIPSPG
jgi:hypothetical protein